MSRKEEIINKIQKQITVRYEMPEIKDLSLSCPDLISRFTEVSRMVGGDAIETTESTDINNLISSIYPDAKTIASNLPYIKLATINPDDVADPHELNGLDVAVIEGEIGVAENGCVWIPRQVKQKVIYFIAEYLVILLDKDKLVYSMHEAYRKISDKPYGFGVFISGPSKTADIEQALVVGAHGARGVTVILK